MTNKYIKSAVRRFAQRILGPGTVVAYTRDALQLASIIDCLPDHLRQPQQHPERVASKADDRVFNWYLPPFDNPFYGGVMTILRLAEYLLRCHSIKQRILICGAADRNSVRANVQKAFPRLGGAEVIVIDSARAMIAIPPADCSVATLWTTAYVLLRVQNTGYKFYMIQDFEPAFYPAGSTYAQAELTYRFGFYGIANTQSLKEIYERDYGGSAVVLRPTVDKSVFFPATEPRPQGVKRLFYYARPDTPRNAFELAAIALTKLKHQHGDSVDIVCAGARWKPAEYGLQEVVRSVGMLSYAETGNLYRSCHAGFVMMVTKHPSYLPFELMACGATVVTNHNEANAWLLKDGENCLLSPPTASCLAATLSYALDHYEELDHVRKRAIKEVFEDGNDWDDALGHVSRFMLSPSGGKVSMLCAERFTAIRNP